MDKQFNKVKEEHLKMFRKICGDEFVITDEEGLEPYTHDHTEDLRFQPEVAVKPRTAEEISEIMKICLSASLPVTPSGARTGLSGGMLPIHGGVILSLERFNEILNIDERNLQATVEPGVITQVFSEAVLEKGLMYPVDPASRGSCFIGGNIAESSGGMRAVKYGTTKDYVLNLEVVLPNGDIINTGANTLKNSTGYNLTQLMVGSEGTLGIITKATFKLIPFPLHRSLLLIPFASAENACNAVSAIFHAKITPSALEFVEKEAIDFGQEFLGIKDHSTEGIEAHLIVEIDGNDSEKIFKECEKVFEVMEKFECGEILFAETADQQERIWKLRRCIGEAVKMKYVYKEEDTVVPRAELAKLWRFVKDTGKEYGFRSICYGHAGDGNLHVNIIRDELSDRQWNEELPKAIRKIFEFTVSLGGTLSGEHGIGLVQKNYMDIAFSKAELGIMKGIKDLFDPKGILNPGKIFPEN